MSSVTGTRSVEVRSTAKYIHISPRKARLVVEHIRGRSVPEARTVLAFSQRAAAREIEKVLRSAIANAETNPNLLWNGDDLVVATVFVDEGPTIKRWRARARGRVARIRKRTCHITVGLTRPEQVATSSQPPKAKREPKAQTPAKPRTPRKKKEVAA